MLAITLVRRVDGSLSSARVAEQRRYSNYGKMGRCEILLEAKSKAIMSETATRLLFLVSLKPPFPRL